MSTYAGLGAVGTIIYAIGTAAYKGYRTIEDTNRLKTDSLNNQIISGIDAREAEEIAEGIRADKEAKSAEQLATLRKYLPLIAIVGVAAIAGVSFRKKG